MKKYGKTDINMSNVQLSKNLSYLLRHGAQKEGLRISQDGWVNISDLLLHINKREKFTRRDIEAVVKTNDKQRFIIEGDRIRANQGHSMKVEVQMDRLTVDTVPEVVVHGTYKQFMNQILKEGLKTMGRQHIHMAVGLKHDRAVISGMRNSADVIIYIKAKEAISDGVPFFMSENKVILTPGVGGVLDRKYIDRVEIR